MQPVISVNRCVAFKIQTDTHTQICMGKVFLKQKNRKKQHFRKEKCKSVSVWKASAERFNPIRPESDPTDFLSVNLKFSPCVA